MELLSECILVIILDQYNLLLKFNDGFESIVDIKPLLGRGFTQELLTEENFGRLKIEAGGGLEWKTVLIFVQIFFVS